MLRILSTLGFALTLCTLAGAQEEGRVVVPNRNGVRPRLVVLSQTNGSITIRTNNGNEVVVESGNIRNLPRVNRDGMKRIDVPWREGFDVEQEGDTMTIRPGDMNSSITLSVPVNTSLRLRCTNSHINVTGVHGEIDAQSSNGQVNLTDVSGTVSATSTNGGIKVVLDQVDPGKPMAFSTLNGKVDVTLPADFKANVKLKTDHGEIWSDFDIKLTGSSTPTTETSDRGRFRLRFDHTLIGTINGGGTEASFTSFNGNIYIRKK